MSTWEDFEVSCTDYLNREFGEYATFRRDGGSDSTVPDIFVRTNQGDAFYIDVKHCPAQCGQFVLLPNIKTQTFDYSPLNANPINDYAKEIIAYMNCYFDEFKEAGTAGKDITIKNSSNIFASWIVHTYKNKGAKFFITNGYTIVPIEQFSDCFHVSAKYRIKRSGSSSVGRNNLDSVKRAIELGDYGITDIRSDDAKLFVTSCKSIHNTRFILNGTEFMFSARGNEYEIRKLSNTFNANVIFSIDLKLDIKGLSKSEFIAALK